MAIDFERLDQAIDHAVEHPDEFDFGSFFARYACGTTACIAGIIALQAGWTPVWTSGFDDADHAEKDGVVRYVKTIGADVIGLGPEQVHEMFIAAGDIRGVIAARNRFAAAARVPGRTWAVGR